MHYISKGPSRMGTERLVEELKKYRAHELVMQDFEKWSDRYKAALDEFNSELEVAGRLEA
jgi:hypothetical protein